MPPMNDWDCNLRSEARGLRRIEKYTLLRTKTSAGILDVKVYVCASSSEPTRVFTRGVITTVSARGVYRKRPCFSPRWISLVFPGDTAHPHRREHCSAMESEEIRGVSLLRLSLSGSRELFDCMGLRLQDSLNSGKVRMLMPKSMKSPSRCAALAVLPNPGQPPRGRTATGAGRFSVSPRAQVVNGNTAGLDVQPCPHNKGPSRR